MRSAVWHGYKDVRIENVSRPDVKPGYVLIAVDWAGICGTDRHEYVGPNFIPVQKPHRLTGRVAPLTIGHEFSGTIAETGEDVKGWNIGDRVTANGTLCCKKCEMCKKGRYNICEKLGFVGVGEDGTFADYVLFEAERLFKIPDNVTQRQALLAEPLACGIHSTRLIADMTGDIAGKYAVVVGPGIIGLACFFAAKLKGSQVLVAGVGRHREGLVKKYGGEYVDVGEPGFDLKEYVSEQTAGKMADISYECVGAQATFNSALNVLKPGGVLMAMGVFEKPPTVDMNTLQEGERIIMTSQAHVDEIGAALQYISEGKINADELITKEVTLETLVPDGFEDLIVNSPKHIKVAIKISNRE